MTITECTDKQKTESKSYSLTWEGIHISVIHKPNYIHVYDYIEVKADEPISITETGYRGIFILPEEIEENRGVEQLITYLLDKEAESAEWQAYLEDSKQGSLF